MCIYSSDNLFPNIFFSGYCKLRGGRLSKKYAKLQQLAYITYAYIMCDKVRVSAF